MPMKCVMVELFRQNLIVFPLMADELVVFVRKFSIFTFHIKKNPLGKKEEEKILYGILNKTRGIELFSFIE